MKNKVEYEWCYETIDENKDIIENDHEDRLKDFQDNRKTKQLCLVRSEGNKLDGLQDRVWAYVKDGKLPERFSDESGHELPAMKVPKKFHKEFENDYKPLA